MEIAFKAKYLVIRMWALFLLFHHFSMKRSHEWIRLPEFVKTVYIFKSFTGNILFCFFGISFPEYFRSLRYSFVACSPKWNREHETSCQYPSSSRLSRNSEDISAFIKMQPDEMKRNENVCLIKIKAKIKRIKDRDRKSIFFCTAPHNILLLWKKQLFFYYV